MKIAGVPKPQYFNRPMYDNFLQDNLLHCLQRPLDRNLAETKNRAKRLQAPTKTEAYVTADGSTRVLLNPPSLALILAIFLSLLSPDLLAFPSHLRIFPFTSLRFRFENR